MNDPLCEGDFYPGDLLNAVLSVDAFYWRRRPEVRQQVFAVIDKAMEQLEEQSDDSGVIREALHEGLAKFEKIVD